VNDVSHHPSEHPVFSLPSGVRNEKVVRNVTFPEILAYKKLSVSDSKREMERKKKEVMEKLKSGEFTAKEERPSSSHDLFWEQSRAGQVTKIFKGQVTGCKNVVPCSPLMETTIFLIFFSFLIDFNSCVDL
jgi:hypothetical protein